MQTVRIIVLAISAIFAFEAFAESRAATIAVDFSGTLTSAVNNVYDDPEVPSGDFFKVGQAFWGSLSFETNASGFYGNEEAFFDLQRFDINIGGIDFSTRFIPRQIYRSSDGSVSFSSGGADQGGGVSLELNLASFFGTYPTAAELNGKTAGFRFDDYYPLGGQLTGIAHMNVESAVSSVPEADTWLLMVLGFGTVGHAIRRRREWASINPALIA